MDDFDNFISDVVISDDDSEVIFLGSSPSESSGINDRPWGREIRRGIPFGDMPRNRQPSGSGTSTGSADHYEDDHGIDLCDSDLSDIEVIEIEDSHMQPHNPVVFREGNRIPNTISHMLEPVRFNNQPYVPSQFQPPSMLTIFSHIHERLRAQAMLLERMQIYTVDSRPRVPPSVILEGLDIRRIRNQDEATELGSCPICLEPYKPRMMVRILPKCQHLIHKGCMDKWISKSHRLTCPLDNIPIEVENATVQPTAHEVGPFRDSRDMTRSPVSVNRSLRRSTRIHERRSDQRRT